MKTQGNIILLIFIIILIICLFLYIMIKIFNKNNYDSKYINKLNNLHNKLTLKHGSFKEEIPEQLMAIRFIKGNEKVLELGSNIGRNTLIIADILNSNGNNNLVTLECDKESVKKLEENKNLNNLNFYIEPSALSKRSLIQTGWDTIVSDVLLDGYTKVDTITFNDLKNKYNIDFDTLVLDCEGAFYYILKDMPEILDNIKLIIMENDYKDIEHKKYIDSVLKDRNFKTIYSEGGGWGPCEKFFFEVWKKY